MTVRLEGQNLIISLDELEIRIVKRAIALLGPIIELQTKTAIKFIFQLLLMGEETFAGYVERVNAGENPEAVIDEVRKHIILNLDSFRNIDVPSPEEMKKILWPH